ncbi:MAG: GNAT family N-acetyltransferase [Oscillibacter sp.]|jgi:ribosomal protein S18 acetylase RimI-like enzyme|nr:GNAT family N-acetyltransferase [Oscillibacter sp.]
MIRKLETGDFDAVCALVNESWKRVYRGYVNPLLLNTEGCAERALRLKDDFASGRLSEFVWEEDHRIAAMLSMGKTADADRAGAFEIWRIYVDPAFQGRGIGSRLLGFAERKAAVHGCPEAVIWAFRENVRAVSFYRKHGYRIEKEEDLGEPYQASGVRLVKRLT